MKRIILIFCGCALVWAMLFLYVGLFQSQIAYGKVRNVNIKGSFYVVSTSSAVSLRQLYWDTNQYVIYESLPKWLRTKLNTLCQTSFTKDSEYVGDVRNLETMHLRPVCATPSPFPPTLQRMVCSAIKIHKKKWTWAWVNIHGDQFACKTVESGKILS